MSPSLIAWTDVETTGLDPATDYLLEVACILTDLEGTPVADPFHRVIHYRPAAVVQLRSRCVEVVREMHDKTGLWDALSTDDASPRMEVEKDLLAYITEHAPTPRTVEVGGNSVRLDLNFLDVWLPKVAEHLHYRTTDVTVLRRVLARWGVQCPTPINSRPHEALADIQNALTEYRMLQDAVRNLVGSQQQR